MGTVKIGDRDVTVEEPSIYKTELIGDKLAAIGKDAPQIQIALGQFIAQYEKANVSEMDRSTAEYMLGDRAKGITEEGWKARGNVLRLPRTPTGTEQVLHIAPLVFTKAKDQALEIAAIMIAPNSELENEAQIDKVVKEHKRYLRHHARPSELLTLLAASTEVIKEVIEAHREEVGKLRSFWDDVTKGDEPQNEHEAALAEVEREMGGGTGDSSPSTDSLLDTAGTTDTSSIESPSETLSTSST